MQTLAAEFSGCAPENSAALVSSSPLFPKLKPAIHPKMR
jgi:hypothetical protein